MNYNIKIFLIIISVVLSSNIYSQSNTTYNFLKLDVDARSSAMAGSTVSMTNDVNGFFYNPAIIATIDKPQGSVGFYKYLLDINSGNAAYSQKFKESGYFGVGIRYFNYGSFDKYDEESNNVGTFSANDLAITLGYANKSIKNLSYGVSLKFIQSNIDVYSSSAVAADLGLLYEVPDQNFVIGVSLLNLGTQLKSYAGTKENVPMDLRIGFNKRLEYLPLTFYFSITNINENQDDFIQRFRNLRLGGEFVLSENINLRIGYNNQERQDLKTGSTAGIGGFSAGLGIIIEDRYHFDYAFNSMGKIGSTHRFNIAFLLK
jgi:long-subunit fatty acid transport protein